MLNPEIIDALKNGCLELECPRMEIMRDSPTKEQTFSGAGCIRQAQDGRLVFRLYSRSGVPPDVTSLLQERGRSGELVTKDELSSLKATDLYGRTWSANNILPEPHVGSGVGTIIHGELQEILSVTDTPFLPVHAFFVFDFIDDLDIPLTASTKTTLKLTDKERFVGSQLNAAEVSACGHKFLFRKENRRLTIEASCRDSSPPAHFELRVVEALRFATGQSLQWSVLQMEVQGKATVRITSAPPAGGQSLFPPPLQYSIVDPTKCVWALFERYLQYVLTYPEQKWHPLSVHLYSLVEAGKGSWDSFGLALGVATEGVLKACFADCGEPPTEFKDAVSELECHVQAWAGEQEVKERSLGAIRCLRRARAKDRLAALAQMGVVFAEHIKAWEDLRHSSAHADHPWGERRQEHIDLCYTVVVLIYRLVFQAIGYEGQYNDYGTHGWPRAQFHCAHNAVP